MCSISDFYTSQSVYTNHDEYAGLISLAGTELEDVFAFIKAIMIHPVDAKEGGIRGNMREELRRHVFCRTVSDLMNHPMISKLVSKSRFGRNTEPGERAILSCDHAALLCTSVLRARGVPVRMRAGFARYIVKGKCIPHWICEILMDDGMEWLLIDPERCRVSVSREEFVTAGELWLETRAGVFDPSDLNVGNKSSHDVLKYELLNDINCLMKQELINYDWMLTGPPKMPGIARRSYGRLSEEDFELLDTLAAFSAGNSVDVRMISSCYENYVSSENRRQ